MYLRAVGKQVQLLQSYRDYLGRVRQRCLARFRDAEHLEQQWDGLVAASSPQGATLYPLKARALEMLRRFPAPKDDRRAKVAACCKVLLRLLSGAEVDFKMLEIRQLQARLLEGSASNYTGVQVGDSLTETADASASNNEDSYSLSGLEDWLWPEDGARGHVQSGFGSAVTTSEVQLELTSHSDLRANSQDLAELHPSSGHQQSEVERITKQKRAQASILNQWPREAESPRRSELQRKSESYQAFFSPPECITELRESQSGSLESQSGSLESRSGSLDSQSGSRESRSGSLDFRAELHQPVINSGSYRSVQERLYDRAWRARTKLSPRRRRFESGEWGVRPFLDSLEELAVIQSVLGLQEDQLKTLQERARVNPDLVGLTNYSLALSENRRSIESCLVLEQLPKSDAWTNFNRAAIYCRSENFEAALECLLRGLAKEPDVLAAFDRIRRGRNGLEGEQYWSAFGYLWDDSSKSFLTRLWKQPLVRLRLSEVRSGRGKRTLVAKFYQGQLLNRILR